ncbi:Na+/H+ antiporter subunit E [Bdellovibrio sp. HCB274]|uniref:Na+/H+ antiporter subunit E n=1 Tax=Bdellovibrio sp. HCB274 TaxID=3394361 RepID=UPI0039B4ED50
MRFLRKLLLVIEIAVIFVFEFIVAVVQVAAWVFRPNSGLKPVIVRMNTVLKNPTSLWLLYMIISLTPGSLVVDLSRDSSILYIHFFHAPDPEQSISTLRRRFESRLHLLFSREDA